MLSQLWKSLLALVFPGGLIFLLAIGFLRPQGLPMWVQQPVAALPYIVLIFGLVFGWYVANSRMVLSLLVLALVERALVMFPVAQAGQESLGQTVVAITAFLVPLNLLAFSILKEHPLLTIRGAIRLLAVLVQAVFGFWLCLPNQHDLAAALFSGIYIPPVILEWTPIPQPALIAFTMALLLHGIRFALHRDPLEGGAIWALFSIFTAYHMSRYGWQPTNFLMAAGLILFATLLQSCHRQTYRDELTGIPGRLAYDEAIGQLGKRYSLAIIGIDQLTQYANVHGKSVSEQVFKHIAPRVQAACSGGQVFRTTGEDLTVLFPGKSNTEALSSLDAIRKSIGAVSLFLRGRDRVWGKERETQKAGPRDQPLPVTLSIGVAEKVNDSSTLSLVIKTAYRALYEAKGTGGNVVKRGVEEAVPVRRNPTGTGRVSSMSEYGT